MEWEIIILYYMESGRLLYGKWRLLYHVESGRLSYYIIWKVEIIILYYMESGDYYIILYYMESGDYYMESGTKFFRSDRNILYLNCGED